MNRILSERERKRKSTLTNRLGIQKNIRSFMYVRTDLHNFEMCVKLAQSDSLFLRLALPRLASVRLASSHRMPRLLHSTTNGRYSYYFNPIISSLGTHIQLVNWASQIFASTRSLPFVGVSISDCMCF